MELPELEPMTVGEVVGRSFKLYAANFLRFLGIFAVLYIPAAALRLPYVLHKAAEKTAETSGKASLWELFVLDLPVNTLLGILATLASFIAGVANCNKAKTTASSPWRKIRRACSSVSDTPKFRISTDAVVIAMLVIIGHLYRFCAMF